VLALILFFAISLIFLKLIPKNENSEAEPMLQT
jgi:hypothetical protein